MFKIIDNGIVQGSAYWAQPLIFGKDTVYVHDQIKELPPDPEFPDSEPLYEYHEITYGKDEFYALMAQKQSALDLLFDTILGYTAPVNPPEKQEDEEVIE